MPAEYRNRSDDDKSQFVTERLLFVTATSCSRLPPPEHLLVCHVPYCTGKTLCLPRIGQLWWPEKMQCLRLRAFANVGKQMKSTTRITEAVPTGGQTRGDVLETAARR